MREQTWTICNICNICKPHKMYQLKMTYTYLARVTKSSLLIRNYHKWGTGILKYDSSRIFIRPETRTFWAYLDLSAKDLKRDY